VSENSTVKVFNWRKFDPNGGYGCEMKVVTSNIQYIETLEIIKITENSIECKVRWEEKGNIFLWIFDYNQRIYSNEIEIFILPVPMI